MKPYRVIARLKNNRLWPAITLKYPDVANQSDAARRLGVAVSDLGRLLSMQVWPWSKKLDDWRPIAKRVAETLGAPAEYLFDDELYGKAPSTVTIEIDAIPALAAAGLLELSASPQEIIEREALGARIESAVDTLTPKEARVLRLRFGLDDGHEHTLAEIGTLPEFMVQQERIRQIEAKALRKLRHPSRARALLEVM